MVANDGGAAGPGRRPGAPAAQPGRPLTVFGFSQGAATISRWIADGKIKLSRMILWSGMFPPDMDFVSAKEILKGKEIVFVYGKEDPFLGDSLNTMQNYLDKT